MINELARFGGLGLQRFGGGQARSLDEFERSCEGRATDRRPVQLLFCWGPPRSIFAGAV